MKTGAAAAAGAWASPFILPSRVWAESPNEKIAVGLIGCGGIARGQSSYSGDAVVAAVCDVRPERRVEFKAKHGNCTDYTDFRELLASKEIDAVHVSTPDHWHVAMGVMAAEAGKHMNIEKPYSLSVDGLRAMDRALAGRNLVFQFGTENRANPRAHKLVDLAANGFLGKITQAIIWSSGGLFGAKRFIGSPPPAQPIPDGLDWDLWQGPAPDRPFNEARLGPGFIWGMHDYSLGGMANMGIHFINIFQWWADVAGHGVPVVYRGKVEVSACPIHNNVQAYDIELEYAKGFKARFLSGLLAEEQKVPGYAKGNGGITFIGEKGWLSWSIPGNEFSCSFASYEEVMRTSLPDRSVEVPPAKGNLNADFIHAIKTGTTSVANWPSTFRSDMIPVLVDLAGRTQSEVRWDPATQQVAFPPSAQPFLRREMREPWGSIVYKYLNT